MAKRFASLRRAWTVARAKTMVETTNRSQEVTMSRFARNTALFVGVVLIRASPVLLILGSPLVVAAIWRAGM